MRLLNKRRPPIVFAFGVLIALVLSAWIATRTVPERHALNPALQLSARDREESTLEPPASRYAVSTPSDVSLDGLPNSSPTPLDRTDELEFSFTVSDAADNPVPNATVLVYGLRMTQLPGALLQWRSDTGPATTDSLGAAQVRIPLQVGLNDVSHIAFEVNHPDFLHYNATNHPVDPPMARAQLQRGGLVTASGWIDNESNRILNLTALLDTRVRLSSEDWFLSKEGLLSTFRIPPGKRAMRLHHVAADGSHWFSQPVEFAALAGSLVHVSAQLHPAATLHGSLAPHVLRPIRDGRVFVNAFYGASVSGGPMLHHTIECVISAEGDFSFSIIPAGTVQLAAFCRGYAIQRVATTDFVHLRIPTQSESEWTRESGIKEAIGIPVAHHSYEEAQQDRKKQVLSRLGEEMYIFPLVTVFSGENHVEISMQATATLTVRVADPQGTGIPGARVSLASNISWSALGISQRIGDPQTLQTGPGGIVVLHDVPHWPISVSCWHPDYVYVASDGSVRDWCSQRVSMTPGGTGNLDVQLELNPSFQHPTR